MPHRQPLHKHKVVNQTLDLLHDVEDGSDHLSANVMSPDSSECDRSCGDDVLVNVNTFYSVC